MAADETAGRGPAVSEPIRPCPECGMPRYRNGRRWSRCGHCEVFNGYAAQVLARADDPDRRARAAGW